MARYYVFRDGTIKGAYPTKEEAIERIRALQSREAHFIKSEYSIIYGEQEFIKYE